MENFIAIKEETLQKFSDSEQGRKIVRQLQKLHEAYNKLSKREQKIFANEFEDKFQAISYKLQSTSLMHEQNEEIIEKSFLNLNLIFMIAVILIGKNYFLFVGSNFFQF